MQDEEIIALYFRRDERAIRETQEKYGAYCFQIAGRILKSREDCEECLSEAWMQVWNAVPPCEPENLKLYLAAVVRNLAFSRYRAGRAEKRGGAEVDAALDELAECVAAPGSPEETVLAGELGREIDRFLGTLAARERAIFLRRYYFTENTRDIAARCGLRESNVLMILSRTRKKLRQHLRQEGYLN